MVDSTRHTVIEGIDELVINGSSFLVPKEDLEITVEQDWQRGRVVNERVVAELTGEIYTESGTTIGDFVTPIGGYDDE